MSRIELQPDSRDLTLLEEMIGYLNFSSGASDPAFLRNLNALFCGIERRLGESDETVTVLCNWLDIRMTQLAGEKEAFADVNQARAIVELLRKHLLPAYRRFHRDLLWHQPDAELWRPLFLGRAFEALLSQGGPWNETDRIVAGALAQLNDYIGYRPVAVLESKPVEPYPQERVSAVPLSIRNVGVACGPYEPLVRRALEILAACDPRILHEAWFDLEMLDEVALDPRAYEFDHPAGKRPNYHFGQWDLDRIDNRGYYRRFVLQQITLDALLSRVAAFDGTAGARNNSAATSRDELMFEAAAVLAGTMLMASGTTGNGPACHGSDITLATLLPHIAAYRDQFYQQLLAHVPDSHGDRLRAETERTRQPFGGARQHLNHELARRRATQMQHVHLAQLYARMGYADAALAQAHAVRIASARMLCQIYCGLTAGHQAIDAHQLDAVARFVPEIEGLLQRGIECGALVDPWNILGFGGNFSLFPAVENSVHDFRVDDLVDLVEQILDLCARAWTDAAAVDDHKHEQIFSAALERLAAWWDKYATAEVSDVKRLVAKEIEVSTNLVAGALSAWHKAGAAAGDVKFWRMFVDQFDSPKAFQLVVEALLDRGDQVASMALMMQWLSQVERTPLEDGDASFHPLALRWLRTVEDGERGSTVDAWPIVAKFFAFLESSAETYWQVPEFELRQSNGATEPDGDDEDDVSDSLDAPGDDDGDDEWSPDESDELFSAAYEDMVYRDSTDDGIDASLFEDGSAGSDFELEEEAQRLGRRLAFLTTVAQLWKQAAIAWDALAPEHGARRELFESWQQQAAARFTALLELVEAAHRFPIPPSTGTHESNVEFDRRRMIKDSLLEQIISTAVETADAGRLLAAASGRPVSAPRGKHALDSRPSVDLLRAVLAGDGDAVRRYWPDFKRWLAKQELLYVPLARGGRPRRIVRARAYVQLVQDLVGWLPRLGLVRETCQLLDLAQTMEVEHPVGAGAVTEYDRLFAAGYQAIVRCLVASADDWDDRRDPANKASDDVRASDMMLVEALQDLTESLLHRWLTHSRTLRLSIVERLANDSDWERFVYFIDRYGSDLFTQMFLNLGNLRAILHQRTAVWLTNLEQDEDYEDLRLLREMGAAITREDAARWLTIAIEAVVENYREYRDYNTTTTHSDHGELLHTLIDFLRLRAEYDRVAWNLKPVVMAHEILVRQNRPAAAELWQQALAERTAEAADANLAKFDKLSEKYGIRLASVAERLAERFTRPMAIDRVRALVGPAMDAAGSGDPTAFAALEQEIESLAREPAGAGLDLPDWLAALEEEVSKVRCANRHRELGDDMLRRIEQVRLAWDDLEEQISAEKE